MWKLEGKRPPGNPRFRYEINNNFYLQDVEYGDKYWIDLAQDRDGWRALVNVVMNFRFP